MAVTQILYHRYVDRTKLLNFCREVFGSGAFNIEVRASPVSLQSNH